MKLLFDQNLSPRLVSLLTDCYPQSAHVFSLGLEHATDAEVWNYARENGFTIVTQDADYDDLVAVEGFPPKVVWIRRGNCPTTEIEALLRAHREAIEALVNDGTAGLLALL